MFKCFYCEKECTCFPDSINHLIEHHPHDEIKFKKQEDNKIKHISFKVIPELCREQGRLITLNETENKIHVSRPNLILFLKQKFHRFSLVWVLTFQSNYTYPNFVMSGRGQ